MAQAYEPNGPYVENAHQFFDALKRAELRDDTLQTLAGALRVLLEKDEDSDDLAAPALGSFTELLTFLRWHPNLPAPALAVNPAGLFTASWQDDGFKLEFQPSRKVRCVHTVVLPDRIEVTDDDADLESVPIPYSLRPRIVAS